MGFFEKLLNTDYMPHGYCFLWQPELIYMHVVGDLAIALAYFSIPLSIFYVLGSKTRDIPLKWVLFMFALFIMLCGLTHVIELIGMWKPYYYLEGVLKVLTAAVSIATAVMIYPLIPVIFEMFEKIDKAKEAHEQDEA